MLMLVLAWWQSNESKLLRKLFSSKNEKILIVTNGFFSVLLLF